MIDAVVISGASGSGKSTLSRWLAPRLKARVLNAGDVVCRAVLAHCLAPASRVDAGRLFMEHFGELALGPLLLRHLRPSERVIIDGLRLPFAKELLEDRLGRTFHLHLDTPDEVRCHRLLLRDGQVDVSEHAESFLHYLRQNADLVIANLELGEFDLGSSFAAPVDWEHSFSLVRNRIHLDRHVQSSQSDGHDVLLDEPTIVRTRRWRRRWQ